jgi:hypothetical protein
MSTAGLSLVGFLDEQSGISHLRNACIPPNSTDAALRTAWQAARTKLGAPFPNAGNPAILPIPSTHAAYILQVTQLPWVVAAMATDWAGATFQLVEIDPLLAFQITVDTERVAQHRAGIAAVPTLDQMLPMCLPLVITPEPLQLSTLSQSLMVRCRNANFRVVRQGGFNDPAGNLVGAGIMLSNSLPFVHVVRYNGRCYLHNGCHRSAALRAAGATHVPCIFRDVPTAEAVGIKTDNSTFSEPLLVSADPPTVAHFTAGRAHEVRLRAHARVIHVHWAEYLAYEE